MKTRNPTTMTTVKPDISLELVKHIIEDELQIKGIPLNETFSNLAVGEIERDRLRNRLYKHFGKDVRPMHSDTIYSYTDKLQKL